MIEQWDICDKNGLPTGRIVSGNQPLREGEYRLVASLWPIDRQGRLLVQLRSATKSQHPNKWAITSGGVQAGETSLQGCLRELKEELGITLKERDLQLFSRSVAGHFIFHDYITHCEINLADVVLQTEEVAEVRWMTAAEIRDRHAAGSFIYTPEDLRKFLAYIDSLNLAELAK